MISAVVLAALLVAQPSKAEKPMAMEPVMQRRVYEAWISAVDWADMKSNDLYPGREEARLPKDKRPAYSKKRRRARYNLMVGATNQVCEAHGIDWETLSKIVYDPRTKQQKFIPEPNGGSGVTMATTARDLMTPTRFNSQKVILPDDIAAAIGYTNPKPPRERKPVVVPRGMYVKPKPPGMPQEDYDDKIREQVERFKEIEERTKNTKFKDFAP